MLLLTMREWLGPSSDAMRLNIEPRMEPKVRHRGLVTSLALADAIRRIHTYQKAFNQRNRRTMAVEFELLTVSTIDDLDDDVIEMAALERVETLKQSAGEWK